MANIFALPDSSLNAFLFSDVGMERNQSNYPFSAGLPRQGFLGPNGRLGLQAEGRRDLVADRQHLADAPEPAGVRRCAPDGVAFGQPVAGAGGAQGCSRHAASLGGHSEGKLAGAPVSLTVPRL